MKKVRKVKIDYSVFPAEYVETISEFSQMRRDTLSANQIRIKTKLYTIRHLLKGAKTEFFMTIDAQKEIGLAWKKVNHKIRCQFQMRCIDGSHEYNVSELREYEFLQMEPHIDAFVRHIVHVINNKDKE